MEAKKNTMGSSATGSAPASEAGSVGGSSPPSPAISLKEWQKPLAEHQTRVLRDGRVMLDAAFPGAGKTYLATQTIRDLGMKTLVVAPKISLSQWRKVIEGMGASDLVIGVTNPENLIASPKNPYYRNDDGWLVGDEPMLLVVDEIHRNAGGPDSKTALAIARWCNKFHPGNKVLALSATPFESPMKMRCLGYLMGFHSFTQNSFYDWCRRNGCGDVTIGWGPSKRRIFRFTVNKKRAEEVMLSIRHEMGDRFISIGPKDIPGFPEETREVELIDLAKKDHDALVRAYAEMPQRIQHLSKDEMVMVLRLRQQAEFCKAQALAEKALEAAEDGFSCFTCLNFTDARLRFEEYLRSKKVPFASVYGGQREDERQAGIDAFQANRVHVIVGIAQACGVALSLHDERHERPRVSLISPGYSAADLVQALGRIRRVGGTAAAQKIVLVAGSVEERVAATVQRKIDCIETLTDRDLMI